MILKGKKTKKEKRHILTTFISLPPWKTTAYIYNHFALYKKARAKII